MTRTNRHAMAVTAVLTGALALAACGGSQDAASTNKPAAETDVPTREMAVDVRLPYLSDDATPITIRMDTEHGPVYASVTATSALDGNANVDVPEDTKGYEVLSPVNIDGSVWIMDPTDDIDMAKADRMLASGVPASADDDAAIDQMSEFTERARKEGADMSQMSKQEAMASATSDDGKGD